MHRVWFVLHRTALYSLIDYLPFVCLEIHRTSCCLRAWFTWHPDGHKVIVAPFFDKVQRVGSLWVPREKADQRLEDILFCWCLATSGWFCSSYRNYGHWQVRSSKHSQRSWISRTTRWPPKYCNVVSVSAKFAKKYQGISLTPALSYRGTGKKTWDPFSLMPVVTASDNTDVCRGSVTYRRIGFTCSQVTCDDGKLPTRWVAVGHGGTVLEVLANSVIMCHQGILVRFITCWS